METSEVNLNSMGEDNTGFNFDRDGPYGPTEEDIEHLNFVDSMNEGDERTSGSCLEENDSNDDAQLQFRFQYMDGKCSICLADIDLHSLTRLDSEKTGKNDSTIDKQLSAIYLVRNLLGIPFEECTKYLKRYGNPATWLTLCSSCSSILEKALNINKQILKLQNELNGLKGVITNKMKVKIEENEGEFDEQGQIFWLTAAYEIRQFVAYADFEETNEPNEEANEEDAADLPNLVTPLIVNTKCEVNSMYFDESEEMNTQKYESDDFDWEPDFEQSPTVESNQMTDWVQYEKSDDDEIPKRRKTRQRKRINSKKGATKFKVGNENTDRPLQNKKNYKVNECPICFKIYDSKLKWRMHIRRSHKPYLFHLYKQVPEGHICWPGACFPYSSLGTRKIKKGETANSGVINKKKPLKKREESEKQHIVSIPKVSVSEGSSSLKSLKTIPKKEKEQLEDAEKVLAKKEPTKRRAKPGRTKWTKKKGAQSAKAKKTALKSAKAKKTALKSFPCKQCTETFSNYVDLCRHKNSTHTVGIKCQTCGKVLVTVRSMENHTTSKHRPKSDSICLGCKKSYPNSASYYDHLKQSEACKEYVVKCSEGDCSRVFPSLQALEVHLELRHIARPPPSFKCSICGKGFYQKANLKGHELTHRVEELPYPCEKCGKKFSFLRAMKEHLQTVHLNKEPGGETYPCPVCNRVFTSRKHLGRHKKLHNEESPYLCTVCGKAYKVLNQLTTHMWSHDPDRYEKYSLYQYKNKTKKKNEETETRKRKKVFLDTKSVSNFAQNIKQDLSLPDPSSSAFESTVVTDTVENIPLTSTTSNNNTSVPTTDSGSSSQPNYMSPADNLYPFGYIPIPLPNLTLVTYRDL